MVHPEVPEENPRAVGQDLRRGPYGEGNLRLRGTDPDIGTHRLDPDRSVEVQLGGSAVAGSGFRYGGVADAGEDEREGNEPAAESSPGFEKLLLDAATDKDAEFSGEIEHLYGSQFVESLRVLPTSAFLADGSEVTVFKGISLPL